MINLNSFPLHKKCTGYLGYIYVIGLSTGTVKAGRTRNPRGRIAEHVRGAAIHGIAVDTAWLSIHHDNWRENESALLSLLGDAEHGNEYFHMDFSDAVKAAESLTYFVMTDDERAAKEAADKARSEAFSKALLGNYSESNGALVRINDGLAAWVMRQLFVDHLPTPAEKSADPAEVKEVLSDYAERTGRDVEEVMNWTYIETLEHLGEMVLRAASLELQIKAWEQRRFDLVRDPFFSKEQTS